MIRKKIQNSFLCIIILLAIILQSLSCNYFTEPEPFVNNDAHPPEIKYKTATLYNYRQDQIVAGTIYLDLTPDFDSTLVKSTTAFIDSINVDSINHSYQLPFQFRIDTRKWSNGKHDIYFKVYKQAVESDSVGLLGLLYAPLQIYKTSLIFDNTSPTAPANITVTLQNKNALISWTPTNLSNFNSYVIRRDGNVIGQIYSQDTSTYIDTTLPDFYKGYYEVGVSNGPETAYSDKYTCTKGELLGLNIVGAIGGLNDQVIFVQPNNYITAVSTMTHTIINQSNNGINGYWTKNINDDTLYCWVSGQKLYTFDVQSLTTIRSQQAYLLNLTNSNTTSRLFSLTAGLNRLYFSISSENYTDFQDSYSLYVFNKNDASFDIIHSSPIIHFKYQTSLSISSDGKKLLTIDGEGIKVYSIEGDSVALLQQSAVIDNLFSFIVDWKNSRLFIMRWKTTDEAIVEAWDTRTLNLLQTYRLPAPYPIYINGIFANSKNLYVAYDPNLHLLTKYDINSGQLIRTWKFSSEIYSLYGSNNGRYLFACTSTDQWIVDIGGNP